MILLISICWKRQRKEIKRRMSNRPLKTQRRMRTHWRMNFMTMILSLRRLQIIKGRERSKRNRMKRMRMITTTTWMIV